MADETLDPWAVLLRQLGAENPFDRQEAIERLRQEQAAKLVELAKHAIPAVRAGFVEAIAGRKEPELLAALVQLASDNDFSVRLAASQVIGREGDWEVPDEALMRLAKDGSDEVALPALKRLEGRDSCTSLFVKLGRDDDASWGIQREANRLVAALTDTTTAIRLTLETIAATGIEMIARESAGHLEARLPDGGTVPDEAVPADTIMSKAARAVRSWTEGDFPKLKKLLEMRAPVAPDITALSGFGKNLTEEARSGALPRAFHASETVDALERALEGNDTRSTVLIGPPGTGKTSIINELSHRLAARDGAPWQVIRVVPAELLVGTKYVGEWQTRVRELIELVAAPQRVILFMPNVSELTEVGLSSSSEQMSAATLLAPEIESGRIAVVGESTPEAWSRTTASSAAFQRLFQRIDVRPLTRGATREVLELVALDAGATVSESALDVTMDVADVYLTDTELPGRAVGLLRRMIADTEKDTFDRADVLSTLEEATGVPPDFLDDSIPLRVDLVRDFLEARVMGQPRAIEQVIDLVTLVKAGLDDPTKPSGVLLFVGPTGVGKTELSRALAELLFGNAQRLQRFDMSEYASYESYERLIGGTKNPGTLTEAVRRQPFSVVLLDEIEKAHVNVFDLCLQIFDAGRLTDSSGRAVSFRKSIVIMTSNLGAKIQTDSGIGFDGKVPPPPGDDEIQRAIGQFFRPEFLGRVDHIVRFDALSPETADLIARREVQSVLKRGGLTRRGVSVDVDAAVFGHLLRKGYSPALGARPLKRTVESLLLMPIARLLAAGESRPGSCIQLRVEGDEVRATLVKADAEDPATDDVQVAPRLQEVLERVAALRDRCGELDARRSAMLAETNEPGFWDDSPKASATLDAMHRVESLLEDVLRLDGELEMTASNKNPKRALRYLGEHDSVCRRLERLFDSAHLGDAYIRLTGVHPSEQELAGVERLARMYTAWARRQGMDCRVLDDRPAAPDSEDTVTLLIEGTGAHTLLAPEAGLHKLRHQLSETESHTALVRVDVLAVPDSSQSPAAAEVEIDVRLLRDAPGRLVTALASDVHLVHRPTLTSLRARTPLPMEEAPMALTRLLGALVTRQESQAAVDIVRRYRFGRSPVVRDTRTGRSSGRVDRVFGGELSLVGDV